MVIAGALAMTAALMTAVFLLRPVNHTAVIS